MTTETARVATADSLVARSGAGIRSETPQSTVVWKVYAALTALAVAFLVAVFLMATGVADTPHT
jgi:energy-coupling factor transporter transmembrane protein EcfT